MDDDGAIVLAVPFEWNGSVYEATNYADRVRAWTIWHILNSKKYILSFDYVGLNNDKSEISIDGTIFNIKSNTSGSIEHEITKSITFDTWLTNGAHLKISNIRLKPIS